VTLARRQLTATLAWLAAVAVLAAAVASNGDVERAFLLAALAAAAGAAAYLAVRTDPAWLLSGGIALSVFSGNSGQLGLPIGPERLLLAGGLLAVVLRSEVHPEHNGHGSRRLPRLTFTHGLLVAASAWAVVSAWQAGTLTQAPAFYGLLDRFGIMAFAVYYVAPVVFRGERERTALLGTLVAVGAYLGLTAFFEGVGLRALVFPSYINDPAVGIHFGRARGPFVEAVANGMGLFIGATAAATGMAVWGDRRARNVCRVVTALCVVGLLFTLTRSIWVSSVVAAIAAMLCAPVLRRWLIPVVAGGVVLVAATLTAVPGLHERVVERSKEDRSVWVRENTSRAALHMIEDRPIDGFGWQRFQTDSIPYFTQPANYPMNGIGEGVHNVFLSHAAELGLPGAALWLCAFVLAIGGALLRRGPPALAPWRVALVAIALQWVIVACLTPLAWTFPTLVLWTWAGVVSARAPQPARRATVAEATSSSRAR
jgi:putative inorganic carbon (hco3(-)) transporter